MCKGLTINIKTMSAKHKIKKMFTQDDIRTVFKLWESEDVSTIAKKANLSTSQVQYLAGRIRKGGFKLAQKHKKGYLHNLIRETLA